jgi:uncharacterized membrane protein YcjF (UPF0283 family)
MAARETRQTWFEVLITPIVIAVVGALGTFVVTREQDRHASELKDAEIRSARQISDAQLQSSKEIVLAQLANAKDAARSAQEVKLLEIFAQQIASNDEVVRLAAVRLLGAVDAELRETCPRLDYRRDATGKREGRCCRSAEPTRCVDNSKHRRRQYSRHQTRLLATRPC